MTKEQMSRSMYAGDFDPSVISSSANHHRKEGGGYWIVNSSARDGPSKEFVSTTTYKAEVLDSSNTAAGALESSVGMRSTIPVTRTSTIVQRSKSEGPVIADMGTLGYVSTYSNMVVKDPLTGGLVASGRPMSTPVRTILLMQFSILFMR